MTWARKAVGRILPTSVKDAIRRTIDAGSFRWRMRRLRPLLADVGRGGGIDIDMLRRISALWGNEGYVADPGFLREICLRARAARGPILDCGSGLTTVLLAAIAMHRGISLTSLEQDEDWYRQIRQALRLLRLWKVDLRYAPLRAVDEFVWYDVADGSLPPRFDLVACDGPAVHRSAWPDPAFGNWRVGVVPMLGRMRVTFGEILLDDAEDPRAPALLLRWEEAGLATQIIATPTGRLVVARPAHDHRAPPLPRRSGANSEPQ